MPDVKSLLEGVEGISEEVALKAQTLFEAAVLETVEKKVKEEIKGIEEAFDSKLAEAKTELAEKYSEKLETKIQEAIIFWANENKDALDKSLKSEVAESFLVGLKTLFTESAVILPEVSVDAISESIKTERDDLETKLSEAVAEKAALSAVVESFKKEQIIKELSEGMVETQKERLVKIAREFSINNESEFRAKVSYLKEAFVVDTKAEKEKKEEKKETEAKEEAKVVDESVEDTQTVIPNSVVAQTLAFMKSGKL